MTESQTEQRQSTSGAQWTEAVLHPCWLSLRPYLLSLLLVNTYPEQYVLKHLFCFITLHVWGNNRNVCPLFTVIVMVLTAILGHEMSHELLDSFILHGHVTATLMLQTLLCSMMWDCISFINTAKQIQDLFSEDWNDTRRPLWLPYASDFHNFKAFLLEDEVQYYIMLGSRLVVMMWSHRVDIFIFIYMFLVISPPFFFFFFTESLCSGQNICVRLCVCLPLTWTNSSSFVDVEPPRLSKQNPALNGWLYRLLWSYACHPLSFHPQNYRDPFGYIHRHTCARPLYTKRMCAV